MPLVLCRRRAARKRLRSEPRAKQCRAAQEITSIQVHLFPPPVCIESNAERSNTRKLLIAPPGGDGFAHAGALRPGPDSRRLARLDAALGPRQFRASFGARSGRRIQPAGEQEALNLNRALPDLHQRVDVSVLRLKERAQREFNAPRFALGDLQLGGGRGDIALIAVEDRQSDSDFEKAFWPRLSPRQARVARLQKLGAVAESAAQEKVGNALGLGARNSRARAFDRGPGALQLGATAEQRGESRLLIERGETFFQLAEQAGRLEKRIAEYGAQLLPHLILSVLGHNQTQLRPLRLDLDLIGVRAVRLSDIEELFSNANGFAGNTDQFGPRLDAPLRAQRFIKEHPNCVQNPLALRDRLLFGQSLFLGEDALALAEFAAEKDGLLDEGEMLALLVESSHAEFFARVADDRVRPKAGLHSPSLGCADRRLCLSQRRIGLQSHSFHVG